MSDTYPARNLGVNSEPWGRAIDDLADQIDFELGMFSADSLSNNRAISGQMGSIGNRITSLSETAEELDQRESLAFPVTGFSVSGGATGSFNSASTTINIPGTLGTRSARVEVQINLSANNGDSGPRCVLDIKSGSELLWGDFGLSGPTTSRSLTAEFITTIPATGKAVTLTAYATRQFSPSDYTVTVSSTGGTVVLYNLI